MQGGGFVIIYRPMREILCPHCQNPTYDDEALLCHYCGNSLARTSSGAVGRMRGAVMKWVWVALGLIMLATTIIMFQ